MTLSEFKRLYRIIKVFLEYGIDELLPEHSLTRLPKRLRKMLFWIKPRHLNKPLGERLRLALQELGPVWIKFGQMMSTRRDLFPPHLADQLALLQDRVSAFDSELAKERIEQSLGGELEQWFSDFNMTPLASASIAQVHTAKLKESGRDVVLKIIRPDIQPIIDADIRLMYQFSTLLEKHIPEARRLKPIQVVREYEKTLLDELDLRLEASNAMQLRHNFKDSEELYVPEVISLFTSENLMVSERIYGIQVSDIKQLKENGTNMKLLAERGVSVFFTQVFRDSFFHADMHPGNVFVSYDTPENPQWIGLDCGIVGVLNKEDKRYLAENLLSFFNRDYHKVAQLHVDSGWVPRDTNVEEFGRAIYTVCDPIFEKPLGEISFGHLLLNLFNTARRFNMEVQPQLVLLQKTLLYIEGLGRELYPQLDLWSTAKPFLEQWMAQQVGPTAFVNSVIKNVPFWTETLPEIPNLIYSSLRQNKVMYQKMENFAIEYSKKKQKSIKAQFLFNIGATLLICSAVFLTSNMTVLASICSTSGAFFWLLSWRSYRR